MRAFSREALFQEGVFSGVLFLRSYFREGLFSDINLITTGARVHVNLSELII